MKFYLYTGFIYLFISIFLPFSLFSQQTKTSKKTKPVPAEKENLQIEKDNLEKEKDDLLKNKELLSKDKEELEKERIELQKQKEEFEKNKKLEIKTEETTEENFFKLEEDISIVSKRVGQSESVSKTSAIVSVYNRQKIADSGARNLADILKQAPGVEISYDQFGSYKVAFRGVLSRSGVLMLLDGHRINNFYDGSTFLDIRADAIEKVEIIRGPGSSIHGTNAFVGGLCLL